MSENISRGVVHGLPEDLMSVILSNKRMYEIWEDITPLARNEWICWIEDAKKLETRKGRIEKAKSKMLSGMRRPCCWAGCPHR
ncbi:MAG: YdeI/OmpD-associated family protein [Patescibacteria group bacterium]